MTRRIPGVGNIALPDTRALTPGQSVLAGSAALRGAWYDIASQHNLNLAMHHAQPCHTQGWDTGVFAYNSAGYVLRYETSIPKLTDQHTNITCRVYGNSPLGGGLVRITATTSGSAVVVALPAVAAWTAAGALLSVAGSFAVNDYETIQVETDGSVAIEWIALEYDQLNPGGAYPAADDALAAGVGPDGVLPLDTAELAADQPLPSDIAATLSAGCSAVASRFRTYSSSAALDPGGLPRRAYRVVVPVWNLGPNPHTVYYRLKVTSAGGGGGDRNHTIQHTGNGTIEELYEQSVVNGSPFGYTNISVLAGTGTNWVTGSFALSTGSVMSAPGAYYGFAFLAITPDAGLDSFTFWGV